MSILKWTTTQQAERYRGYTSLSSSVKGAYLSWYSWGGSDLELDKTTLPGWKHKISKYISLVNPIFEHVYDLGVTGGMKSSWKLFFRDTQHEEYEITKEWVDSMKGGSFDPEHFNPENVEFIDPKETFEIASSDE